MTDLLNEIISLAKQAGDIMLKAQNIESKTDSKSGDFNLVTLYDKEVQNFLFSNLKKILPEAKFIGEEEGTDSPVPLEHGYSFIIDPIDGTTNFIQNYRHSCTSIGLLKDGKPYIGVVYNPYSDEVFYAEKGCGAFINGERIYSKQTPLESNLASFGTSPYHRHEAYYLDGTFDILKKLFPHCQDLRRSGSAALDICYVAAGKTGLFYELILEPYDYCAASVIATEAGAVITQLDRNEITFHKPCSILCANRVAYNEYFEVIK